MKILRYIWASPVIILGWLLTAFFILILSEHESEWRKGVQVTIVRGGFGRWMRSRRWGGFTLGVSIFCWQYWDASIEYHERVHVRQYLAWGPLMLPAYFGLLLLQGYRGNYFERQAYSETAAWQSENRLR